MKTLMVGLLVSALACGQSDTAGIPPECDGAAGRIGDTECRWEGPLVPPASYSVRGVITMDGQIPSSADIVGISLSGIVLDTATVSDSTYRLVGTVDGLVCPYLLVRAQAWYDMAGTTQTLELGRCGSHVVDFRLESLAPPFPPG